MEVDEMLEGLLALPDHAAQRQFLTAHSSQLNDAFVEALKEKAFQLQRLDIPSALHVAGLIEDAAEITGKPLRKALALRTQAQLRAIELGEYQEAIVLYDQAIAIHRQHQDQLGEAAVDVTRVWSLACLSRYEEAFEAGQWAGKILRQHQAWRQLISLTMNLAAIHGRRGEDALALRMLEDARQASLQLGKQGERELALIEQNRGIVLRNLGRFDDSIQASQTALEMNTRLDQKSAAAQAEQNLGITYFILGRTNEALELLQLAREFFTANGLLRHSILVELFTSDCLLQLRRFDSVIKKSKEVRQLFASLGTRFEVAQAVLNEALAYAGLDRISEARASLSEARSLFEAEDNSVWVAIADLETAALANREGQFQPGLDLARACRAVFRKHDLPIREAQACLVAARACLLLRRPGPARRLVREALDVAEAQQIPTLLAAGYHLLGDLADRQGEFQQALEQVDLAIRSVEMLRGRLMVEYRAGFLEDKQLYYEDAVRLCLKLREPGRGLEYAERARSRALLDILALRMDLSLRPRSNADRPLTDELTALCAERDRLYRHMESGEGVFERGDSGPENAPPPISQTLMDIESRITDLWHSLLIRNADYAREAGLSQVHWDPFQPYLDEDTRLLEYFFLDQSLVAFWASNKEVEVCELPVSKTRLQQLIRFFWHNLKAVPALPRGEVLSFLPNAQGILHELHAGLLAPLEHALSRANKLIIVPHGLLHYVPVHALFDGETYALEKYEISYLPAASLLRFCLQRRAVRSNPLILGYSPGRSLPYALEEARTIAELWETRPRLEAEATIDLLKTAAPDCRLLHLATHGDFRDDNPLFSGLALADGWLTTLEVFNLRLKASLVCLSGCRTGRNVIGGGDELLGLMRAFLYAGAASLVLSQWAVEDRSTAQLMLCFHQNLISGQKKGCALRNAQLEFLHQKGAAPHPYFWAPFFLIGDTGVL